MSSYRELRLYMMDNYPGMVINEDTVLYSESTLIKIMPNHIKNAGKRYKQMCGCQTCIIYADMYLCLQIWRKRFIRNQQSIVDTIMQRSRAKNNIQERLDVYKSTMADDKIIPVRAWDATAQIACPKIKVNLNGNEEEGEYFHKFGCVMGACNACPKWSDHPLVDIDSGGGRFGWSCILPKLIRWPLFFHLTPSLRSMEEARDSAAPKENGDKHLPPTGRHITANGNKIINTPARIGVDKGCGNVLWRPDEFYKARAVCSLAETKPCARCHR